MISSITVEGETFDVAQSLPHPFWSGVALGRWEPETFRLLATLLKPHSTFVDIGAWVGPTAIYAAKKCARVVAYECDPVALAELRRNIGVNPDIAGKIRIEPHGIGDSDGHVRLFSRTLGNSETSIFPVHERAGELRRCDESVLVGVRDVRHVFRDEGYANSSDTLVKIDVEGAEFRIVPHMPDIIAESRCVWYVSFHELNVNHGSLPSRYPRTLEMLRSLLAFADLRWWGPDLVELDKGTVLDAILDDTWRAHRSFVFSAADLSGLAGI